MNTELMERVSGGLHVSLLWDRETCEVTVRVIDQWQNRVFELPVPPERAGYAFHHPFAFALEHAGDDQPLAA